MKKILSLLLTAGAILTTAPLVIAGNNAIQPRPLSDDDCVKCHYQIAVDVDSHGQAHKKLSCQECHEEHPPTGTNTIPECSMCHTQDDNEHFTVKKCLLCHNPHKPLLVDFTSIDAAQPACSTCHKEQPEELAANPSGHSGQDCNSCHNQHGLEQGQYQTCLDCHEGHSSAMTTSDCLLCHAPHNPANIAYGEDVPPSLCASCHEDVAAAFKALPTLHSEMACVECHRKKHGNIATCVYCHEQPHDAFMHNKFPECITCHRDPHNLAK
jgi:predicted CXXCH cytochrome family protein